MMNTEEQVGAGEVAVDQQRLVDQERREVQESMEALDLTDDQSKYAKLCRVYKKSL